MLTKVSWLNGILWLDYEDKINHADEGYLVYLAHANVYCSQGTYMLQPFIKEKDYFGLFHIKSQISGSYVVLKQNLSTVDFGNGYKFCNVKYLTKIIAQTNLNFKGIPHIEYSQANEGAIQKLAFETYPINRVETSAGCFDDMNEASRNIFIQGCRAQFAKTMYTEAQVLRYHDLTCLGGARAGREYLQSIKELPDTIELEMITEYLVDGKWIHVLLPSQWNDNLEQRQVPYTYMKGDKLFLKAK